MTRYHYIKKMIYLGYRLSQLPCNIVRNKRDFRFNEWNNKVPVLPMYDNNGNCIGNTYQEAWDYTCNIINKFEGLVDIH